MAFTKVKPLFCIAQLLKEEAYVEKIAANLVELVCPWYTISQKWLKMICLVVKHFLIKN